MTLKSSHRGEYAKTAQRRTAILEAAAGVFSASGFRSGSLREVADRAGLSQAGLLHHFPNKNALLSAVLEWRDADSLSRIGDRPRGTELFRAALRTADHNRTTRGLVELHVLLSAEATSPEHPGHEFFVARYAKVVDAFDQALQEADEDGELRAGISTRATARAIVALMDGLQVQWLLDHESVDMTGELRSALELLFTVDL